MSAQVAAGDLYEIEAGHIAQGKARTNAVKAFASTMIKDHGAMSSTLMAALDNAQRKIAHPSDQLPTDKQAMIEQLKATPRARSSTACIWGSNCRRTNRPGRSKRAMRRTATTPLCGKSPKDAVPIVEQHLAMLKALQPQP